MNEKRGVEPSELEMQSVGHFFAKNKETFLTLPLILKLSELFPNLKDIFIGKNNRLSQPKNSLVDTAAEGTVQPMAPSTESLNKSEPPKNIIELRKKLYPETTRAYASETVDFAALPDYGIGGASSAEQLVKLPGQDTDDSDKFVAAESEESIALKEKWSKQFVELEKIGKETANSPEAFGFAIATELVIQLIYQKNKTVLETKYKKPNDLPRHFILEYLHQTLGRLSLSEIKAWLSTNIADIARSKVNTTNPEPAQKAIEYFAKYMALVSTTKQLSENTLSNDADFKKEVAESLKPKPKLLTQNFRPVSGSDLQQ